MVGHDYYSWRRQRYEMEHKHREAWLIGFFWGGVACIAAVAFAIATGKTLGILP